MGHYFDSIAQDNSFRLQCFLLNCLKFIRKYHYLTRNSIYSVILSPFYQRPWAALRVIAIINVIIVVLFSVFPPSAKLISPLSLFTTQTFHVVMHLFSSLASFSCSNHFLPWIYKTLLYHPQQKLRLWKSKNENSILLSHTDFMRLRFTGVIWLPPP